MTYDDSTETLSLMHIQPGHALWNDVTEQVHRRYQQAFNANLNTYMPAFLALVQHGDIKSLCGFRVAQEGPLFLEQYLDQQADDILSDRFGCPVGRDSLIEFGQLASFATGLSAVHFTLMTEMLVELGFEWCIFTATDPLHILMKRLRLEPEIIVDADPSRIANATAVWGNYYQHQPRILAGNLRIGLERLQSLQCKQKQA